MGIEEVGVRLVAESQAQFNRAMDSADKAVKGFGTTTNQTSKLVQQSTSGMDKFKKSFESFTGISLSTAGAIVAVGAAVKGMIEFSKQAIAAASDMNETLSKSTVVFGEAAGDIEKMGETAASSMGLSKNEAIAAAATYGNLFTSMNMSKDASADMSMNLVQLAADLASFNNIPVAEALEKIRAGLVGEAEPLKSLGININEAALKQEALRLGLIKGNAPLDAAAKAQAAYSLMLKQSSNAQGDFARTSDGVANQQRILEARSKDLTAELGRRLLPAWLTVLDAMNDVLIVGKELFTGNEETDFWKKRAKEMFDGTKNYQEYALAMWGLHKPHLVLTEDEWKHAKAVESSWAEFRKVEGQIKNTTTAITVQDQVLLDATAFWGKLAQKTETAIDPTQQYINMLGSQKYQLDNYNKSLDAQAKATEAAGKAAAIAALSMKPMTAEILLANSGLQEGTPAWWEFARSLGLVDENAANMATKLQIARAEFEKTGDMERYRSILNSIKQDMLGIPAFVNTTWNIGVAQGSQAVYNAMQNAINASNRGGGGAIPSTSAAPGGSSSSKSKAHATGGPVSAGWPYMVGERGPEPFIPAMNGYILSKADAERIYASQVAASIPASIVSAGPSSYSYSHENNYNLSVMTSQSAAVVQRSFAIMKLLAG